MPLVLDCPTPVVPDIVDDATRRQFLGVLGAAGLLAACGTGAAPSADPAAGAGFPRTVRHAGGDLVLDARPSRVVAVGPYSELDVLLALGVDPAARGDDGTPLRSWQVEAGAADVPTFAALDGPDLEALAAVRPELIVVNGTTYANYPDWVETWAQVGRCSPCPPASRTS